MSRAVLREMKMENKNAQYSDIIDLPHHVSAVRPRMSMRERAAQFSPFAALTGYDAAIQETGRLTDHKIELSEDSLNELDRKHQILIEHRTELPEVTVTYFVPDERKSGGMYKTVAGKVMKIDERQKYMLLEDGIHIFFDEIFELNSELFHDLM